MHVEYKYWFSVYVTILHPLDIVQNITILLMTQQGAFFKEVFGILNFTFDIYQEHLKSLANF